MKVYITKYALTAGIQLVEVDGEPREGSQMVQGVGSWQHNYYHGEGRDWHRTFESALRKAEEMRRRKISSIRQQLARVEAMSFTRPA